MNKKKRHQQVTSISVKAGQGQSHGIDIWEY